MRPYSIRHQLQRKTGTVDVDESLAGRVELGVPPRLASETSTSG